MNISARKRTCFLIFFYMILAFSLSAALLPFNYFPTPDGVNYARVGQNFFAGRGLRSNLNEVYTLHPPFYSLLIGAADLFLRDLEFSGHFVSMLAFALTLLPLFLLARDIYSERAAHWASLLYLSHGFVLIYSNMMLSENLFTLLLIFELYLAHSLIRGGGQAMLRSAGMGMAGGLAYLTRPEGLLFSLAMGLAFLLLARETRAEKARGGILFLFAFLVFFLPYQHFVRQSTGEKNLSRLVPYSVIERSLGLSHSGDWLEVKKMYHGLNEEKTRLKIEELARDFDWLDYLRRDNFHLLRSAFFSLGVRALELNSYLFGGAGYFLLGACFFAFPWDPNRKRSELLLLLFLLPFASYLFTNFMVRRYLVIFPVLLIWVGQGLEVTRNWARGSFGLSHRASLALNLILCLALALPSAGYLRRSLTQADLPFAQKEMGLWLKENRPGIEKETVAAEHPYLHFFSGAQFLRLPYVQNLEDLRRYLNHHGARYFAVGDDLDEPLKSAYRFLFDETRAPAGFLPIHTVRGKRKVLVYQITAT